MLDAGRSISVVIPVFNEEEALPHLMERLQPVVESLGEYEIIFVNDGSSDGTGAILDEIVAQNPERVFCVHLRINQGKSLALQAGFDEAKGDLVCMMDADLQDRPEEIPNLIRHMDEKGLDVVNGWKAVRKDPLAKTFPSRIFNKVLCRFSGLEIHDFNCGLKLMKRECLSGLTLYGQLHRFLLLLIANKGYRVGELMIEHAPRRYGVSKFGAKRLYEGFFDFLTVIFITRYLRSPLYMFGYYGIACFLLSFVIGGYYFSLYLGWIFFGLKAGNLSEHPLWLTSPFMLVMGLIFVCFGLLGELIYFLNAERRNECYIARKSGFKEQRACKDGVDSSDA